jgi:hypothetical protein
MRELRELRGEDDMSISRSVGEERTQSRSDLEARVSALEHQVMTLTAAVDAASRLRISTPLRINHDIRIAGGRAVRRILDKGGLIRG